MTIWYNKPIINNVDAGWSSLEARRAHNPEVIGSNPIPAIYSGDIQTGSLLLIYIMTRKETWEMEQKWDFQVNDIVTMKKKHPCGSERFRLLRVGADFRLECLGCGHQMMMPRTKVTKACKKVERENL